jgi:DNA-binding SARP family transcriptional activator
MGHLRLILLGPFQAALDGVPVRLPPFSTALLAYLAVEGPRAPGCVAHPRKILAALLWPEQPDRDALSHLRRTLFDLRHALGDDDRDQPFLLTSREMIQLNPAADFELDVTTFTQALGATSTPDASPLGPEAVRRLEGAVALYQDGFLEGLVVDSVSFQEWALFRREELHWQALGALRVLTAAYEARGEYGQAERYARRLLELQPWQEEAHQQLMRALALGGQRSAALAQYQICAQRLQAELGVAPADETVALYQAIRDGELTASEARPPGGRVSPSITPRPIVPSVFVSREAELAALDGFLEMALGGKGRVAFVSGQAGSGKTALLARFSQQAMTRYPHLVAAGGNCNAQAGSGDPYLPFREILQLLSGEIEAHRAGGSLSSEHARRLWALLPTTARALVTLGPDLVGTFVPGEPLLQRIQAFAPDAARRGRLEALVLRPRGGDRSVAPQADLIDQVTQVLQAVAVQHPLLLLLDDLQWADIGTVALLFHLGRRLREGRILVVGAYRSATVALGAPSPGTSERGGPGARHPLEPVLHEFGREWGHIGVDLDQADGRAFVEDFLDTEPNRLGSTFRETLYQHTGGNPLFTTELLRGLQEGGDLVRDEAGRWAEGAALHWERLPPRVEALIAERFGRLPAACQELLSVASVEGEEFTAEVLARVTNVRLSRVIHRLSETLSKQHRLVRPARLLYRGSGGQTLSCYRFAHGLFQHYIYNHMDEVARVHLHRSVAETLEALRLEGEAEAQLEVHDPTAPLQLAWHYEAAGMPLVAARHRLEAGRWAVRLVAYDEAIAHLERALALLEHVAPSQQRLRLELALCQALVNPAMLRRGWRAPAYTQALDRLSDLTQHPELQGDPHCLAALSVLALLTTWSANPERGRRVGEQLLGLAERGDPQFLMLAHWVLGHSHWLQGQLVAAREHVEQALALHDPEGGRPLSPLFETDPTVIGRSLLGFTLWELGCPDQGRAGFQQALLQAEAIEQPASVAWAHHIAAVAYSLLGRDVAMALSHSQALRPLAGAGLEYGPWAELLAAQAQAQDKHRGADGVKPTLEQGLTRAAESVSTLQALGSGVGHAAQLLIEAQMCAWAGQPGMGLEAVDQALAWIERSGVRVLEAEVWRMRGELLLLADDGQRTMDDGRGAAADREIGSSAVGRPSSSGEVEACFHHALAVAREQQARWLELRATVSLAQLWQAQGRRDEARELLAGIYGWFTEGFDTVDLVEAKALLEKLA